MNPYYSDDVVTLHHGDCLDVLRTLPDASVDAVVTDPPYGLEFMGKDWDAPWQKGVGTGGNSAGMSQTGYTDGVERLARPSFIGSTNPTCRNCGGLRNGRDGKKGQQPCRCDTPRFDNVILPRMRAFQDWCEQWASECLRVLKPGGHMLAFGGSRTWHRLAAGIEDAGFEIRDSIAWLYGSGFPKSLDVSKAIDAAAGAVREVVGTTRSPFRMADPKIGNVYESTQSGDTRKTDDDGYIIREHTAPATDAARQWEGWGTALKPAFEPVVVARKPLVGTVAGNVLAYGTGALNIDGARIAADWSSDPNARGWQGGNSKSVGVTGNFGNTGERVATPHDAGRWPSNVVLDESQAAELDRQSGVTTSAGGSRGVGRASTQGASNGGQVGGFNLKGSSDPLGFGDTGGASRFFPTFRYEAKAPSSERPKAGEVAHPTVKPLDLMRWLVRLVTPPGGVVLEPFAGSGTTVEAAVLEGFSCIAIEREAEYLPLIEQRLSKPLQQSLFDDMEGVA